MREFAIVAILMFSSCTALQPDSFSITLRTGNRIGIDGINASLGWSLKNKPIIEDFVARDGTSDAEAP